MRMLWAYFQGPLVLVLTASTVYMALGLFNLKRPLQRLFAGGILTAGIICLLAEILSLFQMLALPGFLLGHSILLICTAFFWRRRGFPRPRLLLNWRSLWESHFKGEPLLQIMGLVVVVILAASLFVALYSPPNNADSMTYHMARVGYWRQQGSLQHYYANVERQNSLSPAAEMLILWTVLLSRSDRWANLIQYLAFLGSLLGVYAVARRLGFERRQSVFALLAGATIPTFILEATSTQNDLVTGYFLISSLYFLLTWLDENHRESMILSAWAGSLSVLVKSLSGIYLPFFTLLILAQRLSSRQKITCMTSWGIWMAIFLILTCGPFMSRNVLSYGTLTGPTYNLLNEKLSLQRLVGNFYRNIALHIEFPPMPQNLPDAVDRWGVHFSQWLGIDLNDPATTLPGYRFQFRIFRPHEDRAGVGLPMLTLLLIAGGIFVMSWWKGRYGVRWVVYVTVLLLVGLTFITLFRWQPWNTRYHVPLILLACPLLAVLYQSAPIKSIGQVFLSYAVLSSLVLGLASAVFNYSRPLLPVASKSSILQVPRARMMYSNRPFMFCVHKEILSSQPEVRRIGLHVGPDDYEYPLFGKRFERMLFPLPKEVFIAKNALSDAFSKYQLDLVISTNPPDGYGEGFTVRLLPVDCPENSWTDAWRRSAILGAEHLVLPAIGRTREAEYAAEGHTIDIAQNENSSYWLIVRR